MTKRQHWRLLKPNGEMQSHHFKNAQQSKGGRTIKVRTPWYVSIMTARYPYDFNNLAVALRMPYDHPKGFLFIFVHKLS